MFHLVRFITLPISNGIVEYTLSIAIDVCADSVALMLPILLFSILENLDVVKSGPRALKNTHCYQSNSGRQYRLHK